MNLWMKLLSAKCKRYYLEIIDNEYWQEYYKYIVG